MNGSLLLVKTLEALGVTDIFGYIGASVMPVFDALIDSPIKLYTPTSEIGASHAADGYARASGKPCVVLATSGPGATNLVTGIATAYMDSVPMLAITANVAAAKLGKDSFQEVDITGIITPVTKYARIVSDINELEAELKKAYAVAISGRQGPVLIDVTQDLFTEECEYRNLPIPVRPLPVLDKSSLLRAASLINDGSRPLILIGGGASDALEEITALSEKLGANILSTMRAAGAINHPNYLGTVGTAATYKNNKIYSLGDPIIAIGTRFSDKLYGARLKNKPCVHIDIDAAELNKVVEASVTVNADAREALTALLPLINERHGSPAVREKATPRGRLAKLAEIISTLSDGSVNVVTDVGTHQVAVLNALQYVPYRTLFTSAGLGTMGFGTGAAIGASIANGKPSILICGDGGFDMSAGEISTAVKYGVPLTVIIVNNGSLKMISDLQNKRFRGRHVAVDTPKVNYKALARSLGANGKTLTLPKAKEEIEAAVASGGVTVFDFKVR